MTWHLRQIEDVMADLGSTAEGLSLGQAGERLAQYGPNSLQEKPRRATVLMFLDQFRDFMIIVLMAAAVISGVIGELSDTIAILVIVVLNAVIGFVQEYRAERAMAALRRMAAPLSTVIRGGREETVPAAELVPGDMVILEAGAVVPADMRLFEAVRLRIEEAALTGESIAVDKIIRPLQDAHAPLGDRKNMAYKGTFVSYGRGRGVVVATGMDTELGKIAALLQEEEEVRTPLQKRLAVFGRKLAIAVIAVCAIVFGAGLLRGEEPLLMLLTAISLAVAAIPEALPAVVTISLALGARKLVRQNALVRKLPAVETLGSVTYICTDKTGTLTMNRMTVEKTYFDGRMQRTSDVNTGDGRSQGAEQGAGAISLRDHFMRALALNNDARVAGDGGALGDPTETALYEFAKQHGYDKTALDAAYSRVAELPFDSERKCMTTFHPGSQSGSAYVAFTKGAADVMLEVADGVLTSDGRRILDRDEIIRAGNAMAADGLRVLCVGMRHWDALPDELTPDIVERNFTILGLVGMMDPPRPEAEEAVRLCKTAGIRPVMITGDHPLTARAIARRIGILEDDSKAVLTGRELDRLSLEEFEERVDHIRVYARVAPEQKLKIVKALQERGHFVAMTGDGVNDAPALKRSDIGVAMGVTGTDVSKEAAHMILLDDNFATIVRAVKEGRRIFDNIRKFIKYTMTSNSGEIWTMFLAPLVGLPIPLLPIHILWINLVTDGLPGLALAAEPAEAGIMERPPRHPEESIFAHGLGLQVLWVGLLMGAVSLFTQTWSIRTGHAGWQTMVFTVLCLGQMGNVLAIRSERRSFFSQGIFSNKPLAGAFVLTFLLQMATIYVPFLNPIFRTVPLSAGELVLTILLSSVVFLAVETEKFWRRKRQVR